MENREKKESPSSEIEDDDSDSDLSNSSQTTPSLSKKNVKQQLIANVYNTNYEVVLDALHSQFGFKLTREPEGDWDLYWADTGVTNYILYRMKKYQKINHYPSMACLARKNNLAKNLMRMKNKLPDDYNFFPPTWILPYEWKEFKAQFTSKKCKTFIAKPEALSQGKGIILTRAWENLGLADQ